MTPMRKGLNIIINYNNIMPETFKSKVRTVGTSLGVLIPKEIANREKIKAGEEIEVSILKKRNLKEIMKLFGSAKGALKFERDHKDREF